jgi:hypothetical protein
METDWVKRKAMGEQFIEDEKDHIWRSLCTSLQSAANSYSVHYGGVATGHYENDHQFRITVGSQPPYQDAVIDVTFVPPEIRVVCTRGVCKASTLILNPNKDAPFRNSNKEQLTSDQVSELILRSVFFPAERRGVQTQIISPCRSS